MTSLLDLALPYQKKVILDKSKVKVLNFSRQIGKSWTAAYLATQKCLMKNNALVVYLSTGQRAADEALKTCRKFGDAVKILSNDTITYTSNASCITYSNGSRIMSLPGKPESCRGWSVDLLVCDEMAFWQQPDECWQAIIPTLLNHLSGGEKEIIICSTPLGKNSLFFDLCQRAKVEKDWKYFEISIHDAIKDGLNVDLEQLHKLIPDPTQFAIEFECSFADSSNDFISSNLLQFYVDDVKFEDYFIGVDWARSGDGTAITVLGRTKESKIYLLDLCTLHNVEYEKQINLVKEIFKKYNPKAMYGDAGGLGSPIMEELNKKISTRIKPFNFTSINKTDAYEYFRKQIFDRNIFFKEDFRTQIVSDLSLIQQIISENGKISYVSRRANGSHGDIVSSIVLALQAIRDNPINSSTPQTFQFPSAFGSFRSRL